MATTYARAAKVVRLGGSHDGDTDARTAHQRQEVLDRLIDTYGALLGEHTVSSVVSTSYLLHQTALEAEEAARAELAEILTAF